MNASGRPSPVRRLLVAEFRLQRPRLAAAAVTGGLVSMASVALLGLSGWFITAAALAGLAGSAVAQAFNYLLPSAFIRLLAIVRTAARYGERLTGHEAGLQGLAALRPRLFAALASSRPDRALALASGEASARMVQDVDNLLTLFIRRSAPWSAGAGVAAAAAMALLAGPPAAFVTLAAMGLSAFGAIVIARRWVEPVAAAVPSTMGALKTRLSALSAAAPELRAYGLDGWALAEGQAAGRDLDAANQKTATVAGWLMVWQSAITAAGLAVVLLSARDASQPLAALAALALVMGMESASGLVAALRQAGAAEATLDRLDALFDAGPDAPAWDLTSDTLSIDGLVSVSPSARLALTGPSGVGKTTLLEQIIGLRSATAGVTLGGVPVSDLAPKQRRALFAYAAQDIRLIDGSVRDNLRLADPDATDEALWAVLEDAALSVRFKSSPLGLNTPVKAGGQALSGGERRRLGLARAYLRPAPWLVLDEPTEGLDFATEAQVLWRLQQRLARTGQGLLLVSHRPSPAALCEQVVWIEGGDGNRRVRLAPGRHALQPSPLAMA
ncbi:amino acid ABC transporter ATP-binding/permease protein [Brevundimonas sp. PAMC22021]|uniref:amino acid ABC transporter ATP-binding/permease protein n=1 Tax=Brevundimonas sp. PAMC22021 TaxID=2861285 RepID=UPI001C62C045|nr:ATP-binding cassette domain-containing protein [Brevundimonas sp. PAMC22021]QYF87007.1 ATP-binding cassette domain-containing protein [Brevundimonas sp. PAMC22021]